MAPPRRYADTAHSSLAGSLAEAPAPMVSQPPSLYTETRSLGASLVYLYYCNLVPNRSKNLEPLSIHPCACE